MVPTQVAAHELGHSLVGLWDEYGYGGRGSGSGPNCATSADGAWDSWVGSQGVAAFQECSYTNLFRPTVDECMMRTLSDDYCPVCRQEAVLAMYRRLPGLVDTVSIAPGEVSVPEGVESTIEVSTHAPAKLLSFSWTLDGEVVSTDRNLELSCSGLQGELWLDVSDDTSWVREDPASDLHETLGPWTVNAEKCAPSLTNGCSTGGSTGAWLAPLALLALRRRS